MCVCVCVCVCVCMCACALTCVHAPWKERPSPVALQYPLWVLCRLVSMRSQSHVGYEFLGGPYIMRFGAEASSYGGRCPPRPPLCIWLCLWRYSWLFFFFFREHPNLEFNAWKTRSNWISGKASTGEKKKNKKKKNNPQITWQRAVTGLQLSGFGKPLSPPLLLQ